ncbi:hypothetical protein HY388_01530 [Candidatus Daviesbacteria bacterium]|nr:hypothetical protein [Candidatus Daviesbacteria bacterium]
MTRLSKIAANIGVATSIALSAGTVLAQTASITQPNIGGALVGPSTLTGLIGPLVTIFLILATILAFFFLLWGGVQWITSGGDKTATQAARDRITAALVGLVVVFAAYLILTVAGGFLKIPLTNLTVPPVQ